MGMCHFEMRFWLELTSYRAQWNDMGCHFNRSSGDGMGDQRGLLSNQHELRDAIAGSWGVDGYSID